MGAPERWNAFLKQIEQRHADISKEATEAALVALTEAELDPTPLATAWGAIDTRLQELERKVEDTWNAQVEKVYESEGHDRAAITAARAQGESLRHRLEDARESLQHRVFADVARRMYGKALSTQKDRNCPRCGAALEVPLTFRALNVKCAHCHGLSTFEPGALLRNAVAFGAHAIASEAAHVEWQAMKNAERVQKAARSPCPLPLLKSYEHAQIAYWKKYCAAKSQLEPEMRDVALEVRSRMDAWYRFSAEHEEEWRNAGRPREPI